MNVKNITSDKRIAACVDYIKIRSTMSDNDIDASKISLDNILYEYYSTPVIMSISPNSDFDEDWYLGQYSDVASAVACGQVLSGFIHYVLCGINEGRWPSKGLYELKTAETSEYVESNRFDEEVYLQNYIVAQRFLKAFPIISAAEFHNLYGRHMGFVPAWNLHPESARIKILASISREFDENWYKEKYKNNIHDRYEKLSPLTHYLTEGVKLKYSPNSKFDEGFYNSFYPEINNAIQRGDIVSGYYHYLVAGRREARLALYEKQQVLEARLPGVTKTALLDRVPAIRNRLTLSNVKVDVDGERKIIFLLPTINPDITFGGYRSAFELIRRLQEEGWPITIVCTEDANASVEYFCWREEKSIFNKVLKNLHFIPFLEKDNLTVGGNDIVISYSLWDLYFASKIRSEAPNTRVILLSQEYEPIFHDNNAIRSILDEAYNIPHYPIINSGYLTDYFKSHNIGIFRSKKNPVMGKDYYVFEHRINKLKEQSLEAMRDREERILIAYTRPEGHAARNLFEVLIMSLQDLCEEGAFGPEWKFIGLGALTDLPPISLGGGHHLSIKTKMSEDEYTHYISSMDIGLSLMYAPHPSVMPFEFATTGAIVVTNTFENRSSESLASISSNIISGPPTVEGITGALRMAIKKVENIDERLSGIYRPSLSSWDQIFNKDMLKEICNSLPPYPNN